MSLKQSRRSVKSLEVILFQRNKNRRLLVPFNRSVSLLVLTRSLPNFTTLLEASNTQSMMLLTGMKKFAKLLVLLRPFQWSTFQMSRLSFSTLFMTNLKWLSHLLKKSWPPLALLLKYAKRRTALTHATTKLDLASSASLGPYTRERDSQFAISVLCDTLNA